MKPDISLLLRPILVKVLVLHSKNLKQQLCTIKLTPYLKKIQKFSWLAGSNPTVFIGQTNPQHPRQILSGMGYGWIFTTQP